MGEALPILGFLNQTSAFKKFHKILKRSEVQSFDIFERLWGKSMQSAQEMNWSLVTQPFTMEGECTFGTFVKDTLKAHDLLYLKNLCQNSCCQCDDKAAPLSETKTQLIVQPQEGLCKMCEQESTSKLPNCCVIDTLKTILKRIYISTFNFMPLSLIPFQAKINGNDSPTGFYIDGKNDRLKIPQLCKHLSKHECHYIKYQTEMSLHQIQFLAYKSALTDMSSPVRSSWY